MVLKIHVYTCVLAMGAFTLGAFAQTPAANHAAVEKQLWTMERAVNEAVAKGDMKTFHATVGPDTISVDATGISKASGPEFDKAMQSIKLQSWNIDMPQYSWVNDNTVLLMYRWTGKGSFQGQPVPSPTWATTLWTNKGGKWTPVFHQESIAMGPPPAAPAPAAGKK